MADQPQVKVKKVKAYPFAVQLKTSAAAYPAQIVKLTPQGFLAETTANMLQPGDKMEVSFELPVIHHMVSEPAVVIKLYNQWGGSHSTTTGSEGGVSAPQPAAPAQTASGPHVLRLVEIHFQALSLVNKEKINAFLQTLAKAPRT